MSLLSHKEVFERANLGIVGVQERYTSLPVGPYSSVNMLDHGHLVNYGGKCFFMYMQMVITVFYEQI